MNPDNDPFVSMRLRAQHHDLQRMVDRLRVIAAAPEGILLPHRLHYLLESEVGALSGALRAHLTIEEKDGYLGMLSEEAPELEDEIQRRRNEHAVLRERMEELAQMGYGDGNIDMYRLAILELLDLITDHEAEESLLLDRFTDTRDPA